jgi:hypothetical protein
MLLTDLENNPYYNKICSLISEKYSLENLHVFVTRNTYTRSTTIREIIDLQTEDEILTELEIEKRDLEEMKSENRIEVLDDYNTIDINYDSIDSLSLQLVFLTFYKVI